MLVGAKQAEQEDGELIKLSFEWVAGPMSILY